MSGISAKELDKRLVFARKYPAHAHMRGMGLILYPRDDPGPSCSICGGNDAPIVDGMHLEGFCGCSGVWTDDDIAWQMRDDLFPTLIGPPMATWEGGGCPYPEKPARLSPEQSRLVKILAPELEWASLEVSVVEPIKINGRWGLRIGPSLDEVYE